MSSIITVLKIEVSLDTHWELQIFKVSNLEKVRENDP